MKLGENQPAFIKLILRSPDVGDGWVNVSNVLRKVVEHNIAEHPELYETREMAGLQIRLSERGKVLADYV